MSRILTTEESLMNYAAWYALRYFPSLRKLREALMKKSAGNESIVAPVMDQMAEYISEERTVDGLVRMYVEQSKTRPYIEQKLRTKKFDDSIVITTLDTYGDSFISWNAYEQTIRGKAENYLQKGKSKKYITGTLTQKYPNFKHEIIALVGALVPDETDALHREYVKLSQKHDVADRKEHQKVVQKLYLKGFSFDDIKRVTEAK